MGLYSVVQFLPDPVRKEPINVGVIAAAPEGLTVRFADREEADRESVHRFEELLNYLWESSASLSPDDWLREVASRRFPQFVISQPAAFDHSAVSVAELTHRFAEARQPA